MFLCFVILSVLSFAPLPGAQSDLSAPLVISPSGLWDGPDGPWASFNVSTGSPVQTFRTFPGMSLPFVLFPEEASWCPPGETDGVCGARGNFNKTGLEQFFDIRMYHIPMPSYMSYIQDAVGALQYNTFIFDSADNYIHLERQIIAGITTEEIPMGFFGLSAGLIGTPESQNQSLLTNLKSFGQIASSSYSYTAGSVNKKAPASLVMGGYDASRFNSNTTRQFSIREYSMTPNVIIEGITFGTTPPSMWSNSEGAIPPIAIDSFTAQIWLPLAACRPFEDAFHLTWNEKDNLYLVDDAMHARLQQEDTSVTFSIQSSNSIANYTFPYSAFDLNVDYPIVNKTSRYFPLRRVSSPGESVLGRVFLQETYITVDYDRNAFNLSQAYPGGNPRIVAITTPSNSSDNSIHSSQISPGAYAGIGAGVFGAVLGTCLVFIAWRKRWSPFRGLGPKGTTRDTAIQGKFDKAELQGDGNPRMEAIDSENVELEVSEGSHEVKGSQPLAVELYTDNTAHELDIVH